MDDKKIRGSGMHRMLVCRGVAALAMATAFALHAEPVPGLADGWSVMAVKAPDGAKLDQVLPENGQWKGSQNLRGRIPQAPGAKPGNNVQGEYNAWYRKTLDIPGDWKGKSVRLEQDLTFVNTVVFVNGKQAGVGTFPDGSVELAPFLKFGAPNEIKIFATNGGYGTGEGPIAYFGRGDWGRGFGSEQLGAPSLAVRSAAYIDDVYAKPSWRGTQDKDGKWDGKKKLTVQVEVESLSDAKADFSVAVTHENGGAVKSATKSEMLKKGFNVVEIDIPWDNPEPWECVPDAKLYACQATMKAGGEACDDRRGKFLFGFREIWREGKDFMMNGHVQRFRGFWNQGMPKNVADLHKYGYNLSYETHKHWAIIQENPGAMEQRSRAGIAVFSGMPSIYFVHEAIRSNPACTAQWTRCLKHWARSMRNWPCIVAASCGVNQICPERNMRPEFLGQDFESNGVAQNIEFACKAAREVHPNCLYFSHADGTVGDISSSNLYFNFTPLQEREEWLSQWAERGALPWYAAEFGAPYYACWFHSRVPQMTEWLAAYYGDKAYAAEAETMLSLSKAYARECLRLTHGGWIDGKDLYAHNPLAESFSRMLVSRVNRAWRAFGQNGGLMYLTSWNWDEPNTMRDRQLQSNGDVVTFLGGAPAFTDRTHAYRSGDAIDKQLVFIWDGVGENRMSAEWKFVEAASGKVIASGKADKTLKQGDIQFAPISFKAPDVSRKTACRFEVAFSARDMDDAHPANLSVQRDAFDVEVHPAKLPSVSTKAAEFALFDPAGDSAKVLEGLGIAFTPYDTLEAAVAAKPKHLVVGRRALDQAQGLEKAEKAIAEGLRVLVMQQTPAVWQSLGFIVEDSMARQMVNVSLVGVDDADLAHWAGSPMADVPFGNVMKHDTRRGPRWTHTHAIASAPLLIPQRAGFVPLVRGEFDLTYSALLKAPHGKGSTTFCAFDFEGRVGAGKCPAATAVAVAMFRDFVSDKTEAKTAVFTNGAVAERLAKTLGLEAAKFDGRRRDDAVLLVGKDSKLSPAQVESFLGKNAYALVVANTNFAAAVTGVGEEKAFYRVTDRANWGKFPFAGVGPSLLRSRDEITYRPLLAKNGYVTTGGGAFGIRGDGKILLDQLDPFQAADRYRSGDGKAAVLDRGGWGSIPKGENDLYLRNASQSEDNFMRRYALVLAQWGVGAGVKTFARSLYTKPAVAYEPIAQYNVLGPWPSANDDSRYMVDTIFPVDKSKGGDSGQAAEEMAIRGDVQPNPRFFPEGLAYLPETPEDLRFIDWRPVVKSREDGYVDYATAHPLIAAQSFCTCYCVGFLPRETDGKITIRFGVDWRGKIWVNGKPFEPVYDSHKDEGSVIYENVQVYAMPKPGTDLKKFDKENGTFDGKNVITVKAGCGQSAKNFWLNVTKERKPGEIERTGVADLDGVSLYESANLRFDPYEYVYW